MRIALIQESMVWEDCDQNKKNFLSHLNTIEKGTDLVVLPEMFTSGFTMNPEKVYITMEDDYIDQLKKCCQENDFALSGSIVVKENEKYFNRMFFIQPTGKVSTYDKRHLFSLAGEEKVYSPGNDRLIVNYRGWNICPLVCYDLRFPVFSRNDASEYDLLIYVASWPNKRIYAWDTLLKARAIENMSYVVGVNRSGSDENDNIYSGHSQVVDYMGQYLIEPQVGEKIMYCQVNKALQDKARNGLAFLKDADQFTIAKKSQ